MMVNGQIFKEAKTMYECTINLSEFNDGALQELFNEALVKVVRNINDLNTPSGKPREITIKFKLSPNKDDREQVVISFSVKETLVGREPISSTVLIERQKDGTFEVLEFRRNQVKGQLGFDSINENNAADVEANAKDGSLVNFQAAKESKLG